MSVEEVIKKVADLYREFHAGEVILYGSRAKGTARERSDIDIAVTGIDDFDRLVELIEELPTLYSVDLLNLDTCKNQNSPIKKNSRLISQKIPDGCFSSSGSPCNVHSHHRRKIFHSFCLFLNYGSQVQHMQVRSHQLLLYP